MRRLAVVLATLVALGAAPTCPPAAGAPGRRHLPATGRRAGRRPVPPADSELELGQPGPRVRHRAGHAGGRRRRRRGRLRRPGGRRPPRRRPPRRRPAHQLLVPRPGRRPPGRQGHPGPDASAPPRTGSTSVSGPATPTSTPPCCSAGARPRSTSSPTSCAGRRREAQERDGLARMFAGWAAGPSPPAGRRSSGPGTRRGRVEEAPSPTLDQAARAPYHYAMRPSPRAHLGAVRRARPRHGRTPARRARRTPCRRPRCRSAASWCASPDWASTSEKGAIDNLDAAALGYAEADDNRFSYLGGTRKENPTSPPTRPTTSGVGPPAAGAPGPLAAETSRSPHRHRRPLPGWARGS